MRQRIPALDPVQTDPKTQNLLDGVAAKLGSVPNIFRTFAQSPATLQAYLGFSGAMSAGRLDAKVREQIALAVANRNGCDYCASAHGTIGKMVGLDEATIQRALEADADDARVAAILTFARTIVDHRGQVSDAQLDAVRAAGVSDGEIVEIVGNVALNVLTNYFNLVAGTEIDFPILRTAASTAAA